LQMVRDAVRQFVDNEIRPHREELEHGDLPPYDLLRKLYTTFGMGQLAADAFDKRIAAEEAPAMWESWNAGAPTDSDRCSTFADGLALRVAIPLAVAELNPLVQQFELVSEAELEDAMRAYAEAGIRVEGAAAAPLALARREWLPRPLVLIVTGRNVDDALYNRILTSDP